MPQIIDLSAPIIRPEQEVSLISETGEAFGADSAKSSNETMLMKNLELLQKLNDGKINYSVRETAHTLNLSYEFTREAIKKRKIKSKSFGDRPMVNVHELARILTEGING